MRDRLYSTADLARVCGVSISTIKRWTDAGLLRCVRTPGGHRKFRIQDVAQAAKQLQTSLAPVDADDVGDPAASIDELALLLLQDNRDALRARVAEALEVGDDALLRNLLLKLHRHGLSMASIGGDVLLGALLELRNGPHHGAVDDFMRRRAERQCVIVLRHLMDQVPDADPRAPMAMLAGELGFHDGVWLALCHLTLRAAGWRVVELGLDVPLETLERGFGRQYQGLLVLLQVPHSRASIEPLQRHVENQGGALLCLAPTTDPQQLIDELLETAESRERRMLASVV
jgi:excisionase family DNA binding protein